MARGGRGELFAYEARKDGRPVVVLRGREADGGVVVDAEVFPASGPAQQEGLTRPFAFPTREHAMRFVDEALTALQYVNCTVVD